MADGPLSAEREALQSENDALARQFPGASSERQPVHTVCVAADAFTPDLSSRWGAEALSALDTYLPDASRFAECLGIHDAALAQKAYARLTAKLRSEPIEDLRLDFEDGFGTRPDAEEDRHAVAAAKRVAEAAQNRLLPAFVGIRIKPFSNELFDRSARTLELFVSAMLGSLSGVLPATFTVTLTKVATPAQVAMLAALLSQLESEHGLAPNTLKLELMIELPQAFFTVEGRAQIPALIAAADGRCAAVDFGVYDYTTAIGIAAHVQGLHHPACDLARGILQMMLAGTPVNLVDGATHRLPLPVHAAPQTSFEVEENRAAIHEAWRISYRNVRHGLDRAWYQGWDMHAAQLPMRFAAVYAFFLEGFASNAQRLSTFIARASEANIVGAVLDDVATGQALLTSVQRAVRCGAVTEAEARATGLSPDEIHSRSFAGVLEARRNRKGTA